MFNRSSFSPVSFSRISFAGANAVPQQDGKSGYWRLFYYNLQEEALKELDVKKLAKEAVEKTLEKQEPTAAKPAPKPVKKVPTPKTRVKIVERIPPFRHKPDYGPTLEEKQLDHAWVLSLSIQQNLLDVAPYYLKLQTTKAANDEDFNRLFLLMVA